MASETVAILLDGGFVKKRLHQLNGTGFPTVTDVVQHCEKLRHHQRLQGLELFRIYYYDAPPYDGVETNPLSKQKTNFSVTPQSKQHRALLDGLELEPDFAVRRGTLVCHGWNLKPASLRKLAKNPQIPSAGDFAPGFQQKGVDMRIGFGSRRIRTATCVSTCLGLYSPLIAQREAASDYFSPKNAQMWSVSWCVCANTIVGPQFFFSPTEHVSEIP